MRRLTRLTSKTFIFFINGVIMTVWIVFVKQFIVAMRTKLIELMWIPRDMRNILVTTGPMTARFVVIGVKYSELA